MEKTVVLENGVVRGILGESLSPRDLFVLGNVLGEVEAVALGSSATLQGRNLARAAAGGILCAGGRAIVHSLECPVQGAWAGPKLGVPLSLFVEETDGLVYLHLWDSRGLPLQRDWAKTAEQALCRRELRQSPGAQAGTLEQADLTVQKWALDQAEQVSIGRAPLRRITAAVGTDAPEDRAMREVLLALGCRLEKKWRPGIPAFSAGHGGFRLSAQDERGALLDAGQLLALVALIEMENGTGKVAVPSGSSAAVDLVAAGYGGTVLRLDRGGEQARALYAAQPWLWSGPAAAARICVRMGLSGQKLESLISKTPRFHAWRREVPVRSDQTEVLRALARENPRGELGKGLRVRSGGGWVYLTPTARRSALRVMAESPDLEMAAELCDFYAGRAAALDGEICGQDGQEEERK